MSSMLGAFGAGILIGAGLALLFAPKAGSELRQDIENRSPIYARASGRRRPPEVDAAGKLVHERRERGGLTVAPAGAAAIAGRARPARCASN